MLVDYFVRLSYFCVHFKPSWLLTLANCITKCNDAGLRWYITIANSYPVSSSHPNSACGNDGMKTETLFDNGFEVGEVLQLCEIRARI